MSIKKSVIRNRAQNDIILRDLSQYFPGQATNLGISLADNKNTITWKNRPTNISWPKGAQSPPTPSVIDALNEYIYNI